MNTVATKKILITGGTGLIGSRLVRNLRENGHFVRVLVRDRRAINTDEVSYWDVDNKIIDPECLNGIDTIIHLAGAGVADKRWSKKRKLVIVDSRIKSITLIYDTMRKAGKTVDTIISASGVGYYGNRSDEILDENSSNGNGFLATCCDLWEHAVDKGGDISRRIIKLRIGIVLNRQGGALVELEKPVKLFTGAPLGSGKQWVPWIHLDDMLGILEKAVDDKTLTGVYNACSLNPVTNVEFTKALAKKLKRPVWPVHVPDNLLKIYLGEMSEVALISTRASAKRISEAGFKFRYPVLEDALAELYAG